jgi:hypothetical protein
MLQCSGAGLLQCADRFVKRNMLPSQRAEIQTTITAVWRRCATGFPWRLFVNWQPMAAWLAAADLRNHGAHDVAEEVPKQNVPAKAA